MWLIEKGGESREIRFEIVNRSSDRSHSGSSLWKHDSSLFAASDGGDTDSDD